MKKIVGILFLILFAAVIALPTLLSTPWGTALITSTYNASINGRVAIEGLHLSFWRGQSAKKIELFDETGARVFQAKEIEADLTFLDLLFRRFSSVREAKVAKLSASVRVDSSHVTNFEEILSNKKRTWTPPISQIEIHGAEGAFNLYDGLSLKLQGELISREGKGNFFADIATSSKPPRLSVNFKNFPLEIADLLLIRSGKPSFLQALIGPSLSLEITTGEGNQTNVEINSLNIKAAFAALIENGNLVLEKPAEFKYRVTEEAFAGLLPSPAMLQRPAELLLELEKCTLPLSTLAVPTHIEGVLTLGDSLWHVQRSGDTVAVSGASISFTKKMSSIAANVKMSASLVEGPGKLSLEAELSAEERGKSFPAIEDWKCLLSAEAIPTKLLDSCLSTGSIFQNYLGKSLKANIDGQVKKQQGGRVIFAANSERLSLPRLRFNIEGGKIALSAPETLFLKVAAGEPLWGPLLFKSDSELAIDLKKVEVPLTKEKLFAETQVKMEVAAKSGVELSAFGETLRLTLPTFTVDAPSLLAVQCELHTELTSSLSLLEGQSRLSLLTVFEIGENQRVNLPDIRLQLSDPITELQVKGRYVGGQLELTSPAYLKTTLSPDLIHLFGAAEKEFLLSPAKVELAVAPFLTALPSAFQLSGSFKVDQLQLAIQEETVKVQELIIPWELDSEQERAKISFSGFTSISGKSGSFNGKVSVRDWWAEDPQIKGSVNLNKFPTALVAKASTLTPLPEIVGKTVDISFNGELFGKSRPGSSTLHVVGDAFELQAKMQLGEGVTITARDGPAKVKMVLTNERSQALSALFEGQGPNLHILEPAEVNIEIEQLELPFKKDFQALTSISCNMSLSPLIARAEGTENLLNLKVLKASLHSPSLKDELKLSVEAIPGKNSDAGKLTLQAKVGELFDETGKFNEKSLSLDLKASLEKWDPVLFSHLFLFPFPSLPKKLDALIGDPMDLSLSAELVSMNGPVDFSLQGTRGVVSAKGRVLGGRLHLREDAKATLQVTPELGKYLLQDVFPLLKDVKKSDGLITLNVSAAGFSLPLRSLKPEELQVRQATLSLGKLTAERSGGFKTLMNLLEVPASEELNLWFTPLYFSVEAGSVNLERFDMLVNNRYPLACWGAVNFIKDRVNLIVGIRALAIAQAFELIGLPTDYMLQIPVKGTIERPSIDKGRVATRISALLAQTEGTKGLVVGTLLELASGGFGDSKVPPPTTTPFPWDEEKLGESLSLKKKKKAHHEKATESLEKGAKSMIKKLFK